MAQLILFGGGDGGGLLIGSHGVRPVPPFNSDIRLQLHGVSALLNGKGATSQESVNEMGTYHIDCRISYSQRSNTSSVHWKENTRSSTRASVAAFIAGAWAKRPLLSPGLRTMLRASKT